VTYPSAIRSVLKAMNGLAKADPTLVALINGGQILDKVPAGTAMPYVRFVSTTEVDEGSTFAKDGRVDTVTMAIWTDYAGEQQGLLILEELNRVLHKQVLTLDVGVCLLCWYEWSDSLEDPDGEAQQVMVRYRVQALEA